MMKVGNSTQIEATDILMEKANIFDKLISSDEEDESSTEDDESNVEDIKLRLGDKVAPDKSAAKETEAGAEISALVNYVQPVHFSSFESAEST